MKKHSNAWVIQMEISTIHRTMVLMTTTDFGSILRTLNLLILLMTFTTYHAIIASQKQARNQQRSYNSDVLVIT